MRYMSIDIETTGLDPEVDQILEVAAVVDDLDDPRPLVDLPRLRFFVKQDRLSITPETLKLHLNGTLLKEYAETQYVIEANRIKNKLWELWTEYSFIPMHYMLKNPIVAAGKGFASFDRDFLKRVGCKFHHRVLDPTSYYVHSSDKVPPDMKTCLKRADLPARETHRALDDALDVVRLLRTMYDMPVN